MPAGISDVPDVTPACVADWVRAGSTALIALPGDAPVSGGSAL
jgi:hypothetical protein